MPTMRRSKALLIAATLLCAALATMWALWSRGKDGPPIAQPQPTTTESTSAENNTARTGPEPEQTERQPAASPRERVEPIRAESNAAQGVRGRIVDESGAPIAGAKVALLDSASNDPLGKFLAQAQQIPNLALSAAQSDLAGTFLLGLVTPTERKLQLCAVADGYAAEVHGDLAVAAAQWVDLGDIALSRGCVISGRVTVAGTDLPAPQAIVTLASGNPFVDAGPAHMDDVRARRTAAVGSDGRYEIRNAPQKGLFRVIAEAPGFGRQLRDEIELDGRTSVVVDFALPRGLSIEGRLDPAGRPLGAVQITVYPKAAEPPFRGTVGSDGSFAVQGLREGPHLVQVAAEGFQPVERDLVAAGTRDLVIALAPRGRAAVRVLDARGQVLRQYRLAVRRWFDTNGGQIGMVRDAPDRVVKLDPPAEFAFLDGLEDGEFVFQIDAEGHVATLSPPVRIDAATRYGEVTAQLHRGGALTGVVTDSLGRPVAGARVTTQPDGAAEDNPVWRMLAAMTPDRITRTETTTAADGSFSLRPLAHARYQVAVEHADHCRAVRAGVVITEDRTETLAPVRLIRGCSITGRAHAAGKPAQQVQVVLTPLLADPETGTPIAPTRQGSADETSVARVEAVSGQDGRFVLPRRVPPGVYELRGVSLLGSDPGADAFAKILQMKKSTVRIEIGPDQESAEFDVRLDG